MTWNDHRAVAFFFGFVGGLALNIVRWHHASNNPSDKPEFNRLYWAQFFGMAFVGGIWALGNDLVRQITPLIALNIGVSIPAVVKAGASEGIKRRKRRTN
ncbi:MAG TPA: hypothetical protein VKH81_01950 [Candidatus Angelobacter sp.]|nr:hypothetical protein [Candidatus Angelobacter sp.]